MARATLVLLLAVGVVVPALGLEVQSAVDYASKIFQRASNVVRGLRGNSVPAELQLKYPIRCPYDGLFPHPENCGAFVQCLHGQYSLQPCPFGLHYNEKSENCEAKCDAHCDRSLACECEWDTCTDACYRPQIEGTCDDKIRRYAYDSDSGMCQLYFYSGCGGNENSFPTREMCERNCKSTDANVVSGLRGNSVPAESQLKKQISCPYDGLFPQPENCGAFVECYQGKATLQSCPVGLHFNEKTQNCEAKCDAHCDRSLACECDWYTCTDACYRPQVEGMCDDKIRRYAYDSDSGMCQLYFYSGCGGNENSFPTREMCERVCKSTDAYVVRGLRGNSDPAKSQLKNQISCPYDGRFPQPENCGTFVECYQGKASLQSCPVGLHYNEKTQNCEAKCDAHCDRTLACECDWYTCTDACYRPQVEGACDGKIRRYAYDSDSGMCQLYIYSGCGGNENSFPTREMCERVCKSTDDPVTQDLRMPTGNWHSPSDYQCVEDGQYRNTEDCSTYIQCSNGQAYVQSCPSGQHFSEETQRCESPCEANCDATLACKCEWDTCRDACDRPQVEGTCDERIPRYYYDNDSSRCQRFFYSGCGGNENNFPTREICERICKSNDDPFTEVLRMPTESRPSTPDYQCVEDGQYRNTEDCSTYIHCSNGQAYVQPCPSGLHFSEETQRCESPCDANCDATLACKCEWDTCRDACDRPKVKGTCNARIPRYFYKSESGRCQRFFYSGCGGNENNFQTREICERICKSKDDSFNEIPHRPTVNQKSTLDYQCVEDGQYRNTEDCSTYIQCSNGQAYVQECPSGLHFREDTQRCESPCDAKCDATLADECEWGIQCDMPKCGPDCRINYDTKPCPSCDCPRIMCDEPKCEPDCKVNYKTKPCPSCDCGIYTSRPYQASTEDSVWQSNFRCTTDGLYSNPAGGATYINCYGGQAFVMHCPYMMAFSDRTKRCESWDYFSCDENYAADCWWRSPSDAKRGSILAPQMPTEDSQLVSDFTCSKDGLYYNREDCETYIQCSDGQAYVQRCPRDLHFSEETQRCEAPCDAQCDDRLADECEWDSERTPRDKSKGAPQISTRDQQRSSGFTCVEDGLYRNPEDCETFFHCSNGDPFVKRCPSGLHFNEKLKRCDFQCTAHCDESLVEQCGWEQSEIPDMCQLAVVKGPCSDSIKRYFFDASTGRCKVFEYGGCQGNANNFKTRRDCEERCLQYRDMDFTEMSIDEYTTEEEVVTEDILSHSEITCMENGLYADKTDCSRFIQCSNGNRYGMPCPMGLHFNQESQRCQAPCDAHCNITIACQCGWPECSELDVDCEAEPLSGPCKNFEQRYYYDRNNGKCKSFTYGGCGGNTNNFVNREECEQKCQDKLLAGYRCPRYTGKFADFFDCTSYYDCKRNKPTRKRCPLGQAFDFKKWKCVHEMDAECLYKCLDHNAVYPYEMDCHKYIDCVNGISKVERCPPGEAFDKETKNCVAQDTVTCA